MKYFEKTAFKYNKPGHIKKFILMSDKQLNDAIYRQPMMNRLTTAFADLLHSAGLSKMKATREVRREMDKALKKKFLDNGRIGGTIFKTPKGKSVAINKELWKSWSKQERRNVLAHEAFHANVPVLGNSEILAHMYGGMRSGNTIGELKRVAKTRPERMIIEPIVAGAAVGATGMAGKKIVKKIKE